MQLKKGGKEIRGVQAQTPIFYISTPPPPPTHTYTYTKQTHTHTLLDSNNRDGERQTHGFITTDTGLKFSFLEIFIFVNFANLAEICGSLKVYMQLNNGGKEIRGV